MPDESISGMGIHFLFLGNVAAHLVALMSGIASFVLATVQAVRKSPLSARIFWVVGALCLLFAFDQAWQDEHRNTQAVAVEKAAAVSSATSCIQDARVEQVYTKGLQSLNDSQRATIDNEQLVNGRQQSAVNSCVISLGKMNPIVNREISVIKIPVAMRDATSNRFVGMFTPHKVYVAELIITTNQTEARPVGDLRCQNSFSIDSDPQLPMLASTALTGGSAPQRISDREYGIRVFNTGSEWGPNSPIFMAVSSVSETVGSCTFRPQ